MTIDRDKVAKSALKYIQKGQFQKAIEEYRKVLSADPRDIRTRLKLIDLYSRAGKSKEAVDECLQVAESYADQGFYLKAIAVYKQALRVDPENSRLFRNMGELYVKQGLMGDALAAFKRGVDLLRAAGQVDEAAQLLLRMEEMAPENSAIKVHLAEIYLAEGKMEAFADEFDKIVLQLKGEGRARKLLQAVEGFYEKSRRHPSVLKRLAELYADLHEDDKSLQIVREGLANTPADRDLRLLALRSHLALGNLAEARRVALGLFDEAPDDLFILEQLAAIAQARGDRMEETHAHKALAKAYGRQGLSQKEEYHFRKVLELSPEDAEARLSLGEMVEGPVEDVEIVGIDDFWTEGPTAAPAEVGHDALKDGLTEAELYLKYGLEDKAAEKLGQLAELAPNDLEIRQRLRDLCQRRGDRDGWVREQLHIAELLLRQRKEGEALRAYQAILEVAPDVVEARKAIQYLKPEAVPPPRSSTVAIELDDGLVGFVGASGAPLSAGPPRGARSEAGLAEAFAEADFYEAQDRRDDAIACLLRLRQQHPGTASVEARLKRLGWSGAAPGAAELDEGAFVDLQAEVLDAAGGGLAGFSELEVSEFDDIVKEFKSGIAEKLDETDFDTHYNLGVAYKEMGLFDEALEELQRASRSTEKAREAYTSMALVYRDLGRPDDARAALRMALAVPTNSTEDRAAILYELGGLAQEQQDWEGALQAFQKVASLDPSFRDVSKRIQLAQARRTG